MKKILYTLSVGVLVSSSFFTVLTPTANAVTASDWKAGRIIDDGIFTDANSMSTQEIQNFLNAQNPACDNNGTKSVGYYYNASTGQVRFSWFSGGTWVTTSRATFANRYNAYNQTSDANLPFTCLKEYYEVPKTAPGPGLPASNANGAPIPAGAVSAAQLISDAAKAYNISPKVLLVKLHTESAGPLTTDDWPFRNQYLYAMGAHCPDSGPGGSANCDSNYAGFSIQMREAAALLRWYLDNMTQSWWQYKRPYQTNNILWNVVERGCGGSDVYIESKGTAALYTYTPYQPNQAALNNMYGTGDNCSAYGNRNFWRVFSDWFGSTNRFNGSITLTGDYSNSIGQRGYVGQEVIAQFTVANNAPYNVNVGGLGICARNNGLNYDFGFDSSVIVPAKGTITIRKSRVIDKPGLLSIFVCSYNENLGGWASDFYPYSSNMARGSVSEIVNNPAITSALNVTPSTFTVGQPVTTTFTVQNNGDTPVTIPVIGVAVRDANNVNVGFPGDSNVTIPAHGSYTYTKTRSFSTAGNYRFWVTSFTGSSWDDNYPSALGGASRSGTATVYPNPTVSTNVIFTPSSPKQNEPVTTTFTVQNNGDTPVTIPVIGVAVRDANNVNVGFPGDSNVTIPAHGSYTYTKTRSFSTAGNYRFWVTSFTGSSWDDNYPSALGGASRSGTIDVIK